MVVIAGVVCVVVFLLSYTTEQFYDNGGKGIKSIKQPILDAVVATVLFTQSLAILAYAIVGVWIYRMKFTIRLDDAFIDEEYSPIERTGFLALIVGPVLGLLLVAYFISNSNITLGLLVAVAFLSTLLPYNNYKIIFKHSFQKLRGSTWILIPQVIVLLSSWNVINEGSLTLLTAIGFLSPAITFIVFKLYYTYYRVNSAGILMYSDFIRFSNPMRYPLHNRFSYTGESLSFSIKIPSVISDSSKSRVPRLQFGVFVATVSNLTGFRSDLDDALFDAIPVPDSERLDLYVSTLGGLDSNEEIQTMVTPVTRRVLHKIDDTTLKDIHNMDVRDNTRPNRNYSTDRAEHTRRYVEADVEVSGVSAQVGDDTIQLDANIPSETTEEKLAIYRTLVSYIQFSKILRNESVDTEKIHNFIQDMDDVAYSLYEKDTDWLKWSYISPQFAKTVRGTMHSDPDVTLRDIQKVSSKKKHIVRSAELYSK